MITNCTYGTWNRTAAAYSLTLEQSVGDALNGEYTDSELAAVIEAYRDAINAALPDSVSLCGDEFYGPYYEDDCADHAGYPRDAGGRLDISAIVESVDFWAIVERVTAT